MRNDAGWGRRISKETTTYGFFAEKVKNKAGQTRGKRDCMKYAYAPRTVFFGKSKDQGRRRNNVENKKGRTEKPGKIAKERKSKKSVVEKQNPSE